MWEVWGKTSARERKSHEEILISQGDKLSERSHMLLMLSLAMRFVLISQQVIKMVLPDLQKVFLSGSSAG